MVGLVPQLAEQPLLFVIEVSSMYRRQQQGFTLPEASLVLTVLLSFVLLSLGAVKHYQRQNDLYYTERIISEIRKGLQEYYFRHCNDVPFVQPTIALLQSEAILPPEFKTSHPFGSDFALTINMASTPPLYSFTTLLNGSESASDLATRLKTQNVIGQSLSWEGLLRHMDDYGSSGKAFKEFKQYYGESCL